MLHVDPERIRHLRISTGTSTRRIAETLHRSRTWVTSLETHPTVTTITLQELNHLAAIFDTEPGMLLTSTPTEEPATPPPTITRLSDRVLGRLHQAIHGHLPHSASTNPTSHLNALISSGLLKIDRNTAPPSYTIDAAVWHALDRPPPPPRPLPVTRPTTTLRSEIITAATRLQAAGNAHFTLEQLVSTLTVTGPHYRPNTIRQRCVRMTGETEPPIVRLNRQEFALAAPLRP